MEKQGNTINRRTALPKLDAKKIALMGIVLAARIILSYIPGLNIGNLVEIGVGFIGVALTGVLFGPIYAMLLSTIADLLTFFLSGSGIFFPGFTLSAAVGGLIYGAVLWRKELNWKRIFIAVLLVTLIVNLGMNSLWVKMMYGKAWSAFMGMRLVKNLISLPLNTILIYYFFNSSGMQRLIKEFRF